MSWGCPNMLKSRSSMDVVSNRWESIISLFRGYIPLGSRDIKLKELWLPATYNKGHVVKYWPF